MRIEFAIQYIPRRMKELGHSNNYMVRWRHFLLDGNDTLVIKAYNEYYLLIEPSSDFKVRSKAGVYDINDVSINEMQHEHRGEITVYNQSKAPQSILFIQIIPKHLR